MKVAIYTAVGPAYENDYIHGSRVQSKIVYARLPVLHMKIAVYTLAFSMQKTAIYTAAGPTYRNGYMLGCRFHCKKWL